VFNVTLFSPTNGASLHQQYHKARVFITKTQSTATFLKLRSDMLSNDLDDTRIESILKRLSNSVLRDLTDNDQLLVYSTLTTILDSKNDENVGSRGLASSCRDYLLSIFNTLAIDSRKDTLGKAMWAQLLEKAMFTLTNDWSCPTKAVYTLGNFEVTLRRENKSKLNGASFSVNSGTFSYPTNLYSSNDRTCTDILFVNLKNTQWFAGSSGVLNNKVIFFVCLVCICLTCLCR